MLHPDGYERCAGIAGRRSSIRRFNQTYDCDSISLHDWTQFKNFLSKRLMLVLERPELQYLAVEDVSATDLEHIDYLRRCLELPQMRILHDEDERLLIVKLMPGRPHEAAIDLLRELFIAQVPSSLGIFGLGAARCGEITRRQKEADQAYIPENRISHKDWPTVVVEIGVSESLPKLREDARYWLTNSGGQVFVVILISLSFSSKVVTWERWENAQAVAPATGSQMVLQSQTRGEMVASATVVPTLMQTVILPAAGPATGTPFRIPTSKI